MHYRDFFSNFFKWIIKNKKNTWPLWHARCVSLQKKIFVYYFEIDHETSTLTYQSYTDYRAIQKVAFDAYSFEYLSSTIPQKRDEFENMRVFDVIWATFEHTQTRVLSYDAAVSSFLTRRLPEREISLGGISGAYGRRLFSLSARVLVLREVNHRGTCASLPNVHLPGKLLLFMRVHQGGGRPDEGREMKRVQLYGVLFHTPLHFFLINRETRWQGQSRNRG